MPCPRTCGVTRTKRSSSNDTPSPGVWCWRRALGVTRKSCEGTRRLMGAASEKGASRQRGKRLPADQVERRRRTAVEQGLARNFEAERLRHSWKPKELA